MAEYKRQEIVAIAQAIGDVARNRLPYKIQNRATEMLAVAEPEITKQAETHKKIVEGYLPEGYKFEDVRSDAQARAYLGKDYDTVQKELEALYNDLVALDFGAPIDFDILSSNAFDALLWEGPTIGVLRKFNLMKKS